MKGLKRKKIKDAAGEKGMNEENISREEFEALEKRVSGLEQTIQSQMKLNEENFDQVLKLISSDQDYMDLRLKWVITFAVSITALGIAVCVLL